MTRSAGFGSSPGVGCLAWLVVASLALAGCTLSPLQQRLAAIEASARTVSAASEVVHLTAGGEADAQCVPLGVAERGECLDALAARWLPADTVINAAAVALGAWLAAEIAGTGDGGAAMAAALRVVAEIPPILAPYGITLGGGQ
jgi:hypothetical protein